MCFSIKKGGTGEEMLNFSSRLFASRIEKGKMSRVPLEADLGICYAFSTHDNLTATLVADPTYPEQSAYLALSKILLEFKENFSADPGMYEDAVVDIDDDSLYGKEL